jgi:hypothetical protein
MCFVVQNHLARGLAARPRCIPQALAFTRIERDSGQQNVSPFHHSQETSLSLHP